MSNSGGTNISAGEREEVIIKEGIIAGEGRAMRRTGMVMCTGEVAAEFGAKDVDGVMPRSMDLKAVRAAMQAPPRYWGAAIGGGGGSSGGGGGQSRL